MLPSPPMRERRHKLRTLRRVLLVFVLVGILLGTGGTTIDPSIAMRVAIHFDNHQTTLDSSVDNGDEDQPNAYPTIDHGKRIIVAMVMCLMSMPLISPGLAKSNLSKISLYTLEITPTPD
jgi:hypothetical protein